MKEINHSLKIWTIDLLVRRCQFSNSSMQVWRSTNCFSSWSDWINSFDSIRSLFLLNNQSFTHRSTLPELTRWFQWNSSDPVTLASRDERSRSILSVSLDREPPWIQRERLKWTLLRNLEGKRLLYLHQRWSSVEFRFSFVFHRDPLEPRHG